MTALPLPSSTGQIGSKLRMVSHDMGYSHIGLGHWCPGCGVMHVIKLGGPHQWNGKADSPSIVPDTDLTWGDQRSEKFKGFGGGRCHYLITAGTIQYFPDCTHELKGKRVSLPDLPGHLRD